MENYIGKIVFVESADSYRNGEYVIVEQSPNNLFGISTKGGYESSKLETLPLVGDKPFKVVSANFDPAFVKRYAERVRRFATTPSRGEKLQWVEGVYTAALRNAELLEQQVVENEVELRVIEVFDFLDNGDIVITLLAFYA